MVVFIYCKNGTDLPFYLFSLQMMMTMSVFTSNAALIAMTYWNSWCGRNDDDDGDDDDGALWGGRRSLIMRKTLEPFCPPSRRSGRSHRHCRLNHHKDDSFHYNDDQKGQFIKHIPGRHCYLPCNHLLIIIQMLPSRFVFAMDLFLYTFYNKWVHRIP